MYSGSTKKKKKDKFQVHLNFSQSELFFCKENT